MQTMLHLLASALIAMATGASQDGAQWLQGPPPPSLVHPKPGPYYVSFAEDGKLPSNQVEFIKYVVDSWAEPGLQAFAICYSQAPDEQLDWGLVGAALQNVSGALEDSGAQLVVVSASKLCDQRLPRAPVDRALVRIIGVMQTI